MKYNRIMLGQASCFVEDCIKNNYIGADFNINYDLAQDGSICDDVKDFNKK